MDKSIGKIYYHLPGLFEFYELYSLFFKLYREHREYFYDWCEIGSVYGAPSDCIWGGGRVGFGEAKPSKVLLMLEEYGIQGRLTFSNSLLREEHLADKKCNALAKMFNDSSKIRNGIIVYSDLLLEYIHEHYPNLYMVSSTTKVITEFERLTKELKRDEFLYVVPDFRLNKNIDKWSKLPVLLRNKVEFLCNECCFIGCHERKACYENVSRKALGEKCEEHHCIAPDAMKGYTFSGAMDNEAFIGIDDILNIYRPMGYVNFKLEGRGLGSAIILEFLLYYMTKPEHQLKVREYIYLDSMLDIL